MKVNVVKSSLRKADNIPALDLKTGEKVALKLESCVYWHGAETDYSVMAFELLGPTLGDIFEYCGRQFSLKTVLMLADELISPFQCINSKDFLHRDIDQAGQFVDGSWQVRKHHPLNRLGTV
jgi:hypothetical protein